MATMIIPAHSPVYVPVGGNELMLLGEFGRDVTVECVVCQCGWQLKLIADEVLADQQCDDILNAHLREQGWGIDASGDTCPVCTA